MLIQILEPSARERCKPLFLLLLPFDVEELIQLFAVANIKLVREDKAKQVEDALSECFSDSFRCSFIIFSLFPVQMAGRGQLVEKVSEERLKGMLNDLTEKTKVETKIKVSLVLPV
jgi:DNA-binding TFAR19-related protein (PDSD5 family)